MQLYITEKPAQISPLKNALQKNNMYNNVEIIALAGHIMRLYDFKEYDKTLDDTWYNLVINKKIPFYPQTIKKKIKEKSSFIIDGKKITTDYKKKFNEIQQKIDKADTIILAPDPDNEGATLVLEVVEAANALNKVRGIINMSKLDIFSLSKEVEITNQLNYLNMYAAGESRAYYDQIFGFNASIMATIMLGNGNLLQLGGVKLPTIKMVVQRDLEIEQHKEQFTYTIKAQAIYNNQKFDINIYTPNTDNKKFTTKQQAQEIINQISHNGKPKGIIEKFKEKIKQTPPPKPYSLTDLQSEGNKKYKLKAKDTLAIAQKLYIEYKIQSYPRTDSNYYSDGEYTTAKQLLEKLNQLEEFKKYISKIDTVNLKKRKIFDDSKIDVHTALSPTLDISKEKYYLLNDMEANIFDLVATRYIIQFMDDYSYLEIKGQGSIQNDIIFDFTQSVTQNLGYRITENFTPIQRTIPKMQANNKIEILNMEIIETKSKPKPKFTEASLLKAMEKIHRFFDDEEIKKQLGEKGIGTPATRASILEDLKKARKGDIPYFEVDKKGKITSTRKARDLISILPENISSPVLRADMENYLKKIEKGEITKEEYMKIAKDTVNQIINQIKAIGKIGKKKTEEKITNLKCPLCQSPIFENEIVFKCSKNLYTNGKQTGCKFAIFRNQKLLKVKLFQEHLQRLLDGETLTAPNKNQIKLDTSSQYFTKIIFAQAETQKDTLIEMQKTYRYNELFIFKEFRGKKLTKNEALAILTGKEVEIKRKSKAGKEYKITVFMEDGKIKATF